MDANQVLIAAERNKQEAALEMAVHQGDAAEVESLEQDTKAKRDALQELQEANKSKEKTLRIWKSKVLMMKVFQWSLFLISRKMHPSSRGF